MDEEEDFWAQQARLPLFKRDRLWWAEVGFSTIVLSLAMVAFCVVIVVNVIEMLT